MADGANYQGSHARASRSVITPPSLPPLNTGTRHCNVTTPPYAASDRF